jgi:ubiquinone/menaquinone biosynthesis C-methylase UbiE
MAEKLEEWGLNTTWNEILMLINKKEGNILDVACGTGVNIIELKKKILKQPFMVVIFLVNYSV